MQEINITNILNSKEYFNESNNVEMAHPKGFEPLTARFVIKQTMAVREGFEPSMELFNPILP